MWATRGGFWIKLGEERMRDGRQQTTPTVRHANTTTIHQLRPDHKRWCSGKHEISYLCTHFEGRISAVLKNNCKVIRPLFPGSYLMLAVGMPKDWMKRTSWAGSRSCKAARCTTTRFIPLFLSLSQLFHFPPFSSLSKKNMQCLL